MKAETSIFLDAIEIMHHHAESLIEDALALSGTVPSPEVERAYGLAPGDAPADLLSALREGALSTQRWAQNTEKALAEADAKRALTCVVSARTGPDRVVLDAWPATDPGVWTTLYERLTPIYWRAVEAFDISEGPPDLSRQQAYSRWLATQPNPWNGG